MYPEAILDFKTGGAKGSDFFAFKNMLKINTRS